MLIGKQSITFENAPYIVSHAAVVGKKEGEGPLSQEFDKIFEDEFDKILKYEDLDEYKILVYAKKDFKLVDDKFNEYNGKYDKQLLKIYQKEIYNDLMSIRGYYSRVPFEIEQKIEKLSKIKNGVYYIYELLIEIKKKVYLSFIDDLQASNYIIAFSKSALSKKAMIDSGTEP